MEYLCTTPLAHMTVPTQKQLRTPFNQLTCITQNQTLMQLQRLNIDDYGSISRVNPYRLLGGVPA